MSEDQTKYDAVKSKLDLLSIGTQGVLQTGLLMIILEADDTKAALTFQMLREIVKMEEQPDFFTVKSYIEYCHLARRLAENTEQTLSCTKIESILSELEQHPVEFQKALTGIRTDMIFNDIRDNFGSN